MSLRIAFCGPNHELNNNLVRHVKDLIGNEVVDVRVMPNPYQEAMEITKRENFVNIDMDWINLWIASFRRMVELGLEDEDLVISATCGIDQLVVQAAYLQGKVEENNNGIVIADATGQNITGQEMALINRAGAVVQVILNQTEEEILEYWDYVYAVLPVALGVAKIPDAILMQYEDFLTDAPAFAGVQRLPDNEEAAMDALQQEVGKWKEKLRASS